MKMRQRRLTIITEKEKSFLTNLEVDNKLQLAKADYEHTLHPECTYTHGSKSTPDTTEIDLESAVQNAYNSSKFHNFTDYKQNLNLPEGWQLLTTGYNNSKGNGYFGTALWNKELCTIWIIHMATSFTFNFLSIDFLISMWQALFRLDLGMVKMFFYEPQIKSAVTFTDNVKQVLQNKTSCLDIKFCFSGNSIGSWLASLSTYSVKHLQVIQQVNGKYYFTEQTGANDKVYQQPIHIAVDHHLQLSNPNFHERINPIETDRETFLSQNPFPTPKEMAMFAKAAYVELSTPNYEKELYLPDGWEFLTAAFNNSWGNCYFGIAFWNPILHQIVVAHRGTSPSVYNLKRNWSILYKTDYVGISKIQYVPQVISAITFAEQIRKAIVDKPSIRLNFTGHSLGGWLAQVTTFSVKYLILQTDRNHFTLRLNTAENYHPHTIAFETPGCKEMLLKMKNDFAPKYQNGVDIEKRLDITIYLSKPNLINTSNTHVGTIYAFNNNLYGWVDRLSFASHVLQTHAIDNIVNAFLSESNHSKLVQVVSDFPQGNDQRHQLESYDEKSCSLSLFSEKELCLLNILETLQTEMKHFTTNCYIEQKVAGLPKIALDGNAYKLKLTNQNDLNDVVKFTKQGTSVCLKEVLEACNLNTFTITHNNLHFLDNFGLKEFLLESNEHLLQVVADDLIVISAIHSILKNCQVNTLIDSTLYLKWSHLERVCKFIDISVIFSMARLVIIETEQSSGFKNDIINCSEQNKIQKCILILPNNARISDRAPLKEIHIETLDLERTSQEKLLIQVLKQNTPHISATDVFYQNINEEIYLKNVTLYLQTEKDTKFFISCSTKEHIYAYLDKEGIREEFEKAREQNLIAIRNGNREDSEWMKDFKEFCQINPKNRVIWLEISAKVEVPSKACICKCIYDNQLCISRQLQSRWFINKGLIKEDLLSNQLKDTCIIVVEENSDHAKILKQELNRVKNVRFVSSMDDAKEESKIIHSPHHILKFTRSQQIEWKSSVNSLSSIKRYTALERNDTNINEDDFSEIQKNAADDNTPFISETNFIAQTKKIVVIGDVPGMGKTTTCRKVLHNPNNELLIHFDLINHIEDIRKFDTNLDVDKAIQFLLKNICHEKSTLDKSLIKKALKENLQNNNKSMVLTLLFDGFDEIPQEGRNELHSKLLNLLQFLSYETTARVWVTTRKHYLDMLENRLLTLSTTFKKISESVQKEYLMDHWQTVLKLQLNSDEDYNLKSYTDELYSTVRQALDASIGHFMGIPLQMRMLLEVARPKCVDHKIDTKVFKINNVVSLYEAFVESKFKIYFQDKSCSSKTETEKKELKEVCLSKLENLAFHNHFNFEAETLLTKKEKDFENLSECYRLGLIHRTNSTFNNTEFIHRTFQEYFCAQKLFELISDKRSPYVVDLLLSKVLLKEDYRIVRLFLNHQLQTRKLQADDETFSEHICKMWKQNRHRLFDIDGISCSTTLAEENHVSLMNYLISVLDDFAAKMLSIPNIHNETPLAIAIRKEHFTLVDSMLREVSIKHRNEIVEASIFHTDSYEIRNYLQYNCKLESCYEQYFTKMKKCLNSYFLKNADGLLQIDNLLSESDFFKNEALLRAASHGYYETVKQLVSRMKYLDYSHCNGQTALHLAAQKGYFQIVQFLLEQGANCQIRDNYNRTFLHYAVRYSESSDLEILYKYIDTILVCFELKDIEPRGNEALFRRMVKCCQEQSDKRKDFLELFDLLIDCGVDVNKTERNKKTLLMYACKNTLIDVVQYLISKGAKVNLKDKTGKTALDHAIGNFSLTEKEKTVFLNILNQSKSNYIDPSDVNIELLQSSSQKCLKEVVEHLISKGVDVNVADQNGMTALLSVIKQYISSAPTAQAIYRIVNILIENGSDFNEFNNEKITILTCAQQHSLSDMIRYLITAGADVNKDYFHSTPLHMTIDCHSTQSSAVLDVSKILVEKGANINVADYVGTTPLMSACQNNLPEVVEYLISNEANLHATNNYGETALHYLTHQQTFGCKRKTHIILNIARILIENGSNVDVTNKNGFTPLMLASQNCLPEVVEYFISKGANVNATNKYGETALHSALTQISDKKEPQKILSVAKILTENGANDDAADKDGFTPLMLACQNGLPVVVEYLISNGVNVNAKSENCSTALLLTVDPFFVNKNEPETIFGVVRTLIENCADTNAADNDGDTPLMLSSASGLLEVVQYLISKGANLHATNKDGYTALHYAVDIQKFDCKKDPQTILHLARILIENGADTDIANKNGVTPLMLASEVGLREVVEYLILKSVHIPTAEPLFL